MFDLGSVGKDNVDMNEERMGLLSPPEPSSRRRTRIGLLLCMLGASATIIASPTAKSKSDTVDKGSVRRWYQVGRASWYGPRFQGRKTANGERFDMNALTCAHRSLPLGTWLRVTNLVNHRSTFVRVNDRGPLVPSRILDLSYAAAQKLHLLGTSKVKIEPVQTGDTAMTDALVAELVGDRNIVVGTR